MKTNIQVKRHKKRISKKLLSQITRNILENFNPYKIILFGSLAWGYPSTESDIDILIIMDLEESPISKEAEISLKAKPPYIPMDILVRTPEQIQQRLEIGDPFICRIIEEGKVLYERAIS
jgi:predicted nucleotidyltransferase